MYLVRLVSVVSPTRSVLKKGCDMDLSNAHGFSKTIFSCCMIDHKKCDLPQDGEYHPMDSLWDSFAVKNDKCMHAFVEGLCALIREETGDIQVLAVSGNHDRGVL